MNIIFLCEAPGNIERVFTPDQIAGHPVLTWAAYQQNPLPDTEVIFSTWGMSAISEKEIRAFFPILKAVFYAAGSVQDFARPFLRSGVRVYSAWAANAVPVAEFAAAQIILANKGYFQLHSRYARDGFHDSVRYGDTFPGNFGTRAGLLGAGMIGRKVIELLRPVQLEILVFDPFLSPGQAAKLGVRPASLEEIFTTCQCVSCHLANNSQTQGLLGYNLFSKMKDNATFINTGRGAQVVPEDLARAMAEKPGRTALLDVTDPDEPLPPDHVYRSVPNILVTPHRAGSLSHEVRRMGAFMLEEFERFNAGQDPRWEVTEDMLATMA